MLDFYGLLVLRLLKLFRCVLRINLDAKNISQRSTTRYISSPSWSIERHSLNGTGKETACLLSSS
jgi:hypothetical protein